MSTSTSGIPEDKAGRMKINVIRASSLALRYFHEHILHVTKTKRTSTGCDFGPSVHQFVSRIYTYLQRFGVSSSPLHQSCAVPYGRLFLLTDNALPQKAVFKTHDVKHSHTFHLRRLKYPGVMT